MRVTITGATGLIGRRLVAELGRRGDEVTVLSRDPERAGAALGVPAGSWDPEGGPAPAEHLAGRDAVVHLAGESISQRWSDEAKERIRTSREHGTANLVAGLRAADPRPGTLVSSSAVGIYGSRGDEELDEDSAPGTGFLAEICVAWEREADAARELGLRVVTPRTGVVLDKDGGALAKMLPFFRLGAGGPVAGGRQWLPWIHADDILGLYLAALDDPRFDGPVNATAEPVRNKDFSKALGRALNRPAFAPVPGFAVRALYGDMAELVTEGQRAVPRRLRELGFALRHPELDEALRSALGD
jgi:uncharacterized protein (TIGR01777 family)